MAWSIIIPALFQYYAAPFQPSGIMPEWSQNYPGIMPECPGMPRDGKTLFEMSFPLLELCYAVLHCQFSLSTQYESLSYGAKGQLDSVSSQCSSQRLTGEAVDRLLAQMELSTGIPGGVDLHRHSGAFDVDNAIGSIMTQYPDLDAIEREYDPEYKSPFDKRPNMRNSYCMACQGFCTGHCDNPLPAN